MAGSDNKRIYYATHQVGIQGDSAATYTMPAARVVHGLQSAGIATNFNLEQVFELGQLSIYENIEEIPDIEVTLSKVLDGYPLIYHMATEDAVIPTLAGRSTDKCFVNLSIFSDTSDAAEGTPGSVVGMSGLFVNSVSYTFPVDGNFTEDVTLVGNDKVWAAMPDPNGLLDPNLPTPAFQGGFSAASADSPIGLGGVNRRQDLQFTPTGLTTDVNGSVIDADATILPQDVFGISTSGTNEESNAGEYDAHVSNITVSTDFSREEINELGRRSPYTRNVTFPVEVTCEIEVTSTSGDMVAATENGIYTTGTAACSDGGNLQDRTIRIATCEGTRIYLGTKNKLASVNYGGGDAGGGNVSVTYSYSTFNDFTVLHSGDPNIASGTPSANEFWADRYNQMT